MTGRLGDGIVLRWNGVPVGNQGGFMPTGVLAAPPRCQDSGMTIDRGAHGYSPQDFR